MINTRHLTHILARPWLVAPRQRWFWAGVVVGVLLALGYLIRQPADTHMSTIEGFYTPNVQYGAWYVANHYRLFDADKELPRISNYTSGLNYSAINYTYAFVVGSALILSGARDVQQIGALYLATPWQALLLIPLAAFALYGWAARVFRVAMEPIHLVVLFAFATFPNYPMIAWAPSGGFATPIGWLVFFGIYLAIMARHFEPQHSWQWSILLVVCLLLLQPTYHTAAMVLTIFLVTIWVIQRQMITRYLAQQWTGSDDGHMPYLRNSSVQLTVVVFISFLLYHAVQLFNDYGHMFLSFLTDVYRSDDHERLRYSMTGSNVSLWWHVVNYAAVLVPVVWLGVGVLRRQSATPRDAAASIYPLTWLVALVPLSLMLFAWDGVYGVYARLLQYGTLIAIASAALLLATRQRVVVGLLGAAVVCVCISTFLMGKLDVSSSNYLTKDEVTAIDWIVQHHGCDTVLFTDFRIGTTLGYDGCFAVVGPTAHRYSQGGQIEQLAALMYSADGVKLNRVLDTVQTSDGRRPDTVLLSRRFLDPQIGFVLPDTRLQPMSEAQWETYRNAPGWKLAYSNSSVIVMVRNQ